MAIPYEQNPDQVIITSATQAEIHGWKVGNTYPTVAHAIEVPDVNGYQIYVHSVLYNRSVSLSTTEYKLLDSDMPKKPDVELSLNTDDKVPLGYVIEAIRKNEPAYWLVAAIVYPTIEIAKQVAKNMKEWSKGEYTDVRCTPVYAQSSFKKS